MVRQYCKIEIIGDEADEVYFSWRNLKKGEYSLCGLQMPLFNYG